MLWALESVQFYITDSISKTKQEIQSALLHFFLKRDIGTLGHILFYY